MEEWLSKLRSKLINLSNQTYSFFNSNYTSTDFQMWYEEVKNIFNDYKFGNKLYEDDFRKLQFRITGISDPLSPLNKPFFKSDLEKSRDIINKIVHDIDVYCEKFVKIKYKKEEEKQKINQSLVKEDYNIDAYKVLCKFENLIRSFIKFKLQHYYSEESGYNKNDWYQKGFPKEIIEKINKNKGDPYSVWYKMKIEYPIEYLEFTDYRKIIEYNEKEIFKESLKTEGNLRDLINCLEKLRVIRNKIAHCISLPFEDINILKGRVMEVSNLINNILNQ